VIVADVVAEILRREGVKHLFAYPLNPLIEAAARAGIRPIIVRQERIAGHMADAGARVSSGRDVGVFCMQSGPGVENAFGAVAQAYAEGVPMVVMPVGPSRNLAWVKPAFNATLNFMHVTKWAEQVSSPADVVEAMRRAFTQARNGKPGPVLIEIFREIWGAEFVGELDYEPTTRAVYAPAPAAIDAAAVALVAAERPLIYAGQGVHYAGAWAELRQLAELLESPVTTSLNGKSAFPEDHPLALGSGGLAMPGPVFRHVQDADVILGAGASFTSTAFGIQFPTRGKTFIHNTLDPVDINKKIPTEHALVGDSKLTLAALVAAVGTLIGGAPRGRLRTVVDRIDAQRTEWLREWTPLLESDARPLEPYRVIRDLMATVDVANTVITHDAGSPRDELIPFWTSITPLSYLGWGKSTQLGYGLGLAMGAKLAQPDKLCINVWGDAAIGMTGMDLETAVRERIPILSILFNNFSMAMEIPVMPTSTANYRSTDISGNYADFAAALGAYGERVTEPGEIVPAILRGIAATEGGRPALLEFITTTDKKYSTFAHDYH
jgi:acetolactate synthase I/II/III large subunit